MQVSAQLCSKNQRKENVRLMGLPGSWVNRTWVQQHPFRESFVYSFTFGTRLMYHIINKKH